MQRYFSNEKTGNQFILSENDMHHIKNVMRMKNGDYLEIVYQEKLYNCKLNDGIEIISLVEDKLDNLNVVLIVPVLKEQKMDYILQKATELGVSSIMPVRMSYCNINYKDKEEAKVIRWNKICKEASQQSKRLSVPKVEKIVDLKGLSLDGGLKILCSTKEKEKSIKNVLNSRGICDTLYIVAGPEGGFTFEEEEYLKQKGFIPVTLGKRVLRAETVPLFVLSVINYENME